MSRHTSSYRQSLLAALEDPVEASAYLNAALEDSPESFLKALKNVAQAKQMAKVARDAGVQRETLYRSLSGQGNPTLVTLSSVLKAVGLKMSIVQNVAAAPIFAHTANAQTSYTPAPRAEHTEVFPLQTDGPRHDSGGYAALSGRPIKADESNSWEGGGLKYAACGNC